MNNPIEKELQRLKEKIESLEFQVQRHETYGQGCAKRLHNCIMEKKAKEIIITQQKKKIAKQVYIIEQQSQEIEQLKNRNHEQSN